MITIVVKSFTNMPLGMEVATNLFFQLKKVLETKYHDPQIKTKVLQAFEVFWQTLRMYYSLTSTLSSNLEDSAIAELDLFSNIWEMPQISMKILEVLKATHVEVLVPYTPSEVEVHDFYMLYDCDTYIVKEV